MWSARRWRYLLNLIDHLPRDSYYSQAVANDEEHAKLLAAMRKDSGEKYAPPMALWSMEAELIATLVDELKRNTYYTILAGGSKGAPKPEQYPRPKTAIHKATWETRQAKHNALAARILPHKARRGD